MKRIEIEALLPQVFQRAVVSGTSLFALLEVMEGLITPCETTLDRLGDFLDPHSAPDRFVPMLARWVDLDRFLAEGVGEPGSLAEFPGGLACLRELVANASYLSQWRGTSRGLLRFLETATGMEGFTVEEQPPGADDQPRPFHLSVHAPAEAGTFSQLIDKIIAMEKPAYVTYDVTFG